MRSWRTPHVKLVIFVSCKACVRGYDTHKEAYMPPTHISKLSVDAEEVAASALVIAMSFLPLIGGGGLPLSASGILPFACL